MLSPKILLVAVAFLGLFSQVASDYNATYYDVWACNTFDLSPNLMRVSLTNTGTKVSSNKDIAFGDCAMIPLVGASGEPYSIQVNEVNTTGSTQSRSLTSSSTLVGHSGQNVLVVTSTTDKQGIQLVKVPPSTMPNANSSRLVLGNFATDFGVQSANLTLSQGLSYVNGSNYIQLVGSSGQGSAAPLANSGSNNVNNAGLNYQQLSSPVYPVNALATWGSTALMNWAGQFTNATSNQKTAYSLPLSTVGNAVSAWYPATPATNECSYAFLAGSVGANKDGNGYKMVKMNGGQGGTMVLVTNTTATSPNNGTDSKDDGKQTGAASMAASPVLMSVAAGLALLMAVL